MRGGRLPRDIGKTFTGGNGQARAHSGGRCGVPGDWPGSQCDRRVGPEEYEEMTWEPWQRLEGCRNMGFAFHCMRWMSFKVGSRGVM